MYLPKYSYFGDYHLLLNVKSNLVFNTLSSNFDGSEYLNDKLPNIIFMCIEKEKLQELCELFPQTAENIRKRAIERR